MKRLTAAALSLSLLSACLGFKDDGFATETGYDFDQDDDGYQAPEDCDDTDPNINPAGVEICDNNNADEDCDGLADDADPDVLSGKLNFWPDADGDGYGAGAGPMVEACDQPAGYVANASDCDDSDASLNPDTGCSGGTYSGNIEITLDAFIFVDVCVGTLFVNLSETAQPQVSGEGSCDFTDFFASFGENHILLDGRLSGQSMAGNMEFSILDDTTWTGRVQGDQLIGSFSSTSDLGGFPITYESSFTLQAR